MFGTLVQERFVLGAKSVGNVEQAFLLDVNAVFLYYENSSYEI